mmetsp:Transcript_24361/g.30230  ORF Transcript_24361/g.30230 Transcript_24361/m.30230 type:complete len:152 (-) Transcript_24361:379-834(-)
MGCTCSTTQLLSCTSGLCKASTNGMCSCANHETEEIMVGGFDRPAFVKWLAEQIHEALEVEEKRPSTLHQKSLSKFFQSGPHAGSMEDFTLSRTDIASLMSPNRRPGSVTSTKHSNFASTSSRKRKIGVEVVRKIILGAFTEFKGIGLTEP